MNFNMWKKCKVVMLSTNKANPLVLNSDGNLEHDEVLSTYGGVTQQHLYILSDDEIKYDDWVLGGLGGFDIKQYGKYFAEDWKKIIATTDTSLSSITHSKYPSGNTTGIRTLNEVPQLPQSFIEHYIQEYNKGNIITDVLVEYYWEPFSGIAQLPAKLKINPKDNTITIKKVKDSWTREEVEDLCVAAFYHKDLNQGLPYDYTDEGLDKWIKTNLP